MSDNKSRARAIHDAHELYWQVVGMVTQLRANEFDKEAAAWQKAVDLLTPTVKDEIDRIERDRKAKIEYHKAQMRPDQLRLTEALDEAARLKAEAAKAK